ncbi:MAG: hypothetical protein HZB40_12600 [Rhodocyclales bacterium]|nr:hypothetical protein [Rhodocyclales bacterium]
MDNVKTLAKFRVPIGNQAIELQEFVYEAGGMPMLRTRIREGSRFTIFDIDPLTAAQWGKVLSDWAAAQPGAATPGGEA